MKILLEGYVPGLSYEEAHKNLMELLDREGYVVSERVELYASNKVYGGGSSYIIEWTYRVHARAKKGCENACR